MEPLTNELTRQWIVREFVDPVRFVYGPVNIWRDIPEDPKGHELQFSDLAHFKCGPHAPFTLVWDAPFTRRELEENKLMRFSNPVPEHIVRRVERMRRKAIQDRAERRLDRMRGLVQKEKGLKALDPDAVKLGGAEDKRTVDLFFQALLSVKRDPGVRAVGKGRRAEQAELELTQPGKQGQHAFFLVYGLHWLGICRRIAFYRGNSDEPGGEHFADAEDSTEAAFIKLWERPDIFNPYRTDGKRRKLFWYMLQCAKNASFHVWLETMGDNAGDFPVYERNEDGSLKRRKNGTPIEVRDASVTCCKNGHMICWPRPHPFQIAKRWCPDGSAEDDMDGLNTSAVEDAENVGANGLYESEQRSIEWGNSHPEAAVLQKELEGELENLFSRLPATQRATLMQFRDGLRPAEIAKTADKGRDAVDQNLRRARKTMRREFGLPRHRDRLSNNRKAEPAPVIFPEISNNVEQRERIRQLGRIGTRPAEIASTLSLPQETVRAQLWIIKKKLDEDVRNSGFAHYI